MERNPEENHHAEDREQGVNALANLLGGHLDLLGRDFGAGGGFLRRIGEALAVGHVDHQRNEHHHDRRDEGIVETAVENVEVGVAEGVEVAHGRAVEVDRRSIGGEVRKPLADHVLALLQVFVAQRRELGVVVEVVDLQPPVTHADGDERGEETADIDEHVENLETRLAFGAEFAVVVHLAHERLQVALEQAVAEGDHQQSQTGQRQVEPQVRHGCRRRDGDEEITDAHHDQTPHDRRLVVLGFVGDDAADQRQQVDRSVEARVDVTSRRLVEPELGRDEQGQDRHHDIETEAFAHVGEGRRDQSFGLSFHKIFLGISKVLVNKDLFSFGDKDRKIFNISGVATTLLSVGKFCGTGYISVLNLPDFFVHL